MLGIDKNTSAIIEGKYAEELKNAIKNKESIEKSDSNYNAIWLKRLQYVIGMGFGDEGKGNVTQWLCKEAIKRNERPIVIRFCGGPQAGHTVTNNNIWHTFASFGSGTLLGVPTYIYPLTQCLIDPIALKAEYDVLVQKGITPEFYIHPSCFVINPYHVIANRDDKESIENGTCGCGIWWALQDRDTLYTNSWYNVLIKTASKYKIKRQKQLEMAFYEAIDFIKDHIVSDIKDSFDTYIFESTQGLALDAERGFYPYVTPCEVFPHDLFDITHPFGYCLNFSKPEVFLVSRTYTTRHGAGYEPKSSYILEDVLENKFESNKDNIYQGKFKKGILDVVLLNKVINRHCLNNYNVDYNFVLTHCDILRKEENKFIFPFFQDGYISDVFGKFKTPSIISNFLDLQINKRFESYSPESDIKEINDE